MNNLKNEYTKHTLALVHPTLKNGAPCLRNDPIAKSAKKVMGRASRVAVRLNELELAKYSK